MSKPKKKQSATPRGARPTTSTRQRVMFLMVVFGIITFVTLFGKLTEIMIFKSDFYKEKAIANQTRDVPVTASRGTISDSKGNRLAISSKVYNVILSPLDVAKQKLNQSVIAQGLADILDLDRADVLKRMEKTYSAYEIVAKGLEEEQADEIRKFAKDNKLSNSVYLVEDSKRYYPYSSLAAQVVGFVNSDNAGAFGLESYYNDTLSGKNGQVVTITNGDGTEMLSGYEAYVDAENGYNLNLTIDATIQSYAERIVEEGIQMFDVQNGGFCIVMDPDTAAVLAMVSSPDYDLNEPGTITDSILAAKAAKIQNDATMTDEEKSAALGQLRNQQWSSKALNEEYEPGSTFKPIVVAAALEEGTVTEHSTFHCSGVKQVDVWPIHCSARRGHGSQDLRRALMNSCNPALIEIGWSLGDERFYQYLENFGFSKKTGIDMYNEGRGTIWAQEEFMGDITSLAVASFGQGLTVTPIQLVTAISAVINGGHLMTPYVVQSVTDGDGNVISYHDPQEVRQVISQDTSDLVRSMMESVVSSGTGKNARSDRYSIGGKTGSSETIINGSRDNDRTIVSFVGFAPADDPEIVVLLAFDAPKPASPGSNNIASGTYISGGAMAAPLAGELITNILDYMGTGETSGSSTGIQSATMPNLSHQVLAEGQRVLNNKGLNYRLVGEGDVITDQLPLPGANIPQGSTVVLYMGGAEKDATQVTVPNVLGRSYSSAKSTLEKAGLYISASGTDGSASMLALSQSVEAGSLVNPGTVVQVRFIDNSVRDTGY